MKCVALFNLQPVEGELPHQWATQRESEAFYGIAAADHFHQRGRGLYHGLSSLAATQRPRPGCSFRRRSPTI